MGVKAWHRWYELQTSLWFIPGSMSLAAVALSAFALEADARIPREAIAGIPLLYEGGPSGASAVLSVIAGSVIGVTGVVFSVTIVALSFASTQFGPRLLRTFMRDPANKLVLGTFIATFIFSLLGLQAVGHPEMADPVPELTVTVAIALAFASLAMLIYFIHHISSSIRAESVIEGVSRELESSIDHLYPEEMGYGADAEERPHPLPDLSRAEAATIRAPTSGYLRVIDDDRIMELAVEHDIFIRCPHRPGDWIMEGSELLSVWPAERVRGDLVAALVDVIILGPKRTAEQDVEFSVNQLVEVASRSLSPGINDPFTAIVCVDRLGAALCRLCSRRLPSPYREDARGRLRVVARCESLESVIAAALNPLRQYARSSVPVILRILETIASVARCTGPNETARRALREHAGLVWGVAQDAGHHEADLHAIRERYERAIAALDEPGRGVRPD